MLRNLSIAFAALLSACISHKGHPVTSEAPASIKAASVAIARNVVYTPANWPQLLAADLFTPEGAGTFPAIVMVHGGGWAGRSRDDMESVAQAVAKRGYVVMNVSYRFAPQWHFPAQLQDLQQAVLWLRANAAARKLRPDHIGTWGYSAGAHLAALLGVTGPGDKLFVDGARVQAVVAGGPPVDVRYYLDGISTNKLMGVAYTQDPEIWRNASPIALVTPDDPPMFLYHGTFDFTVGDRNSKAMYGALNAAKVPAELYLVHGLDHFLTFFLDAPVESGIEFLDRHLR